jgi:hypothetical protein
MIHVTTIRLVQVPHNEWTVEASVAGAFGDDRTEINLDIPLGADDSFLAMAVEGLVKLVNTEARKMAAEGL